MSDGAVTRRAPAPAEQDELWEATAAEAEREGRIVRRPYRDTRWPVIPSQRRSERAASAPGDMHEPPAYSADGLQW